MAAEDYRPFTQPAEWRYTSSKVWKQAIVAIALTLGILIDILGIVSASSGGLALFNDIYVRWPVFVMASAVPFGIAIAVVWPWLNRRRASVRFQDAYGLIDGCRALIAENMSPLGLHNHHLVFAYTVQLSVLLHSLRISVPVADPNDRDHYNLLWFNFLVRMAAFARAGRIEEARKCELPTLPRPR